MRCEQSLAVDVNANLDLAECIASDRKRVNKIRGREQDQRGLHEISLITIDIEFQLRCSPISISSGSDETGL